METSKRGEIATLLVIASFVVLTVASVATNLLSKRQTTSSRADTVYYECFEDVYSVPNCPSSVTPNHNYLGRFDTDRSRDCRNRDNNTKSAKITCTRNVVPTTAPTSTSAPYYSHCCNGATRVGCKIGDYGSGGCNGTIVTSSSSCNTNICDQLPTVCGSGSSSACQGRSPGELCNGATGFGSCTQAAGSNTCSCVPYPTMTPIPTQDPRICGAGTTGQCAGKNYGAACSTSQGAGSCYAPAYSSVCSCVVNSSPTPGAASPTRNPNATTTPIPTATPVPRGTCHAEGSSCNPNDPDACGAGCQSLGCDAKSKTCVVDTGTGPCPVNKCDGNKCNTHYVGYKGGSDPPECPSTGQCTYDSDCGGPPANSCTGSEQSAGDCAAHGGSWQAMGSASGCVSENNTCRGNEWCGQNGAPKCRAGDVAGCRYSDTSVSCFGCKCPVAPIPTNPPPTRKPSPTITLTPSPTVPAQMQVSIVRRSGVIPVVKQICPVACNLEGKRCSQSGACKENVSSASFLKSPGGEARGVKVFLTNFGGRLLTFDQIVLLNNIPAGILNTSCGTPAQPAVCYVWNSRLWTGGKRDIKVIIKSTANCPKKAIGDANCDDLINNEDRQIWIQEYTGQLNTLRADFNDNEQIDFREFEVWRRNKGK